MSTLNPAVYRKAADVIHTGGLRKEGYGPFDITATPHCTVGALRVATGRLVTNGSPEVQFLGHLLGLPPCDCSFCRDSVASVTDWNDELSRTAADVIGLLIEAAEKLEAEQGVTI